MDAAKSVTATFTPASFTLAVSIAGGVPGVKVLSSPAGIDCPGVCATPFPNGQVVTLTPSTPGIASAVFSRLVRRVHRQRRLRGDDGRGPERHGHLRARPGGRSDGDGIPNGVEPARGPQPAREGQRRLPPHARLFAMQMYRDFLGREGDAAGITGWTDLVTAGTYNRNQVIDAFLSSPEFAGFVSPVVRLYFATFLRVPDYDGLTFNAGLVRNGTVTLTQLADFFTASPEFVALYGSLDNAQFVTLLYSNVLGRAPDPAGLAGWVALLDGGMTRGPGAAGLLGLRRVPGRDGQRGVRDDDVRGDAAAHAGAHGLQRLGHLPRRRPPTPASR